MLARRFDLDDAVSPATIRSLRERIDLLEEENRQLRDAGEAIAPFPAAWKLTKVEARFLSALMRAGSGRMSNERLLTALYGLEPDVEPEIVKVWVCKVRKKLTQAGTGIEIRTLWGEGFGLSAADRDKLHAILAAEPSAAARHEREIEIAITKATAELEASLWALKAENDRLRQIAPPQEALMVTPYYPPRKAATLKRQVQCLTFAAVEHANGYWSYIARYGDITAYTMKGWPDASKWMDLPECLADAARTLAYFAEHETEIRAFLAMTPEARAAVVSHGAIVTELAVELAKREAVARAGGPKR